MLTASVEGLWSSQFLPVHSLYECVTGREIPVTSPIRAPESQIWT